MNDGVSWICDCSRKMARNITEKVYNNSSMIEEDLLSVAEYARKRFQNYDLLDNGWAFATLGHIYSVAIEEVDRVDIIGDTIKDFADKINKNICSLNYPSSSKLKRATDFFTPFSFDGLSRLIKKVIIGNRYISSGVGFKILDEASGNCNEKLSQKFNRKNFRP